MGFSLKVFMISLWLILLSSRISDVNGGALQIGFYNTSCPTAEAIVRDVVEQAILLNDLVPARLLRLYFHDCFVRGCDASLLLDNPNPTRGTVKVEKEADPNLTVRGYDVIDTAKATLEEQCPGIVSCADIAAIAARDSVTHLNASAYYEVETGRRDGNISIALEAVAALPDAFGNFSYLRSNFANVGLNVKDLVVLSGGHTIGQSQCGSFSRRIYNYTMTQAPDPSLNLTFLPYLREQCPVGQDGNLVEMVADDSRTFDNDYYVNVMQNKGLFHSDGALLTDDEATAYVMNYIANQSAFFQDFGVSMRKMGENQVLTGQEGEIRLNCGRINGDDTTPMTPPSVPGVPAAASRNFNFINLTHFLFVTLFYITFL